MSSTSERKTTTARLVAAEMAGKAQHAVARRATGIGDLTALLDMLGLLPEDQPRDELGRPYSAAPGSLEGLDPAVWWRGTLAAVPVHVPE